MKVPNILKDIRNARRWTRKAVVGAESSPLVHLVPTDEVAIELIRASYGVFQAKHWELRRILNLAEDNPFNS